MRTTILSKTWEKKAERRNWCSVGAIYIKNFLAHALRICLSFAIATLYFDGVAWLGTKYFWIYTLVQKYGIWVFGILLYLALHKAYQNFGSWKRKDILWERFALAPKNFPQEILDDTENVMLVRDDREKKVRTYRNLVSGDLIATTYDVPLRKQKNRRNRLKLLCVLASLVLTIGLQAVPRVSAWNQRFGSTELSYVYDVSDGLPGVQTYAKSLFPQLPSLQLGSKRYVLPASGARELTEEDIAGMDKETIQLAINEIYAKNGYDFASNPSIQEYFLQKSWYHPSVSTMAEAQANFSEVERYNVNFLAQHRD